jgi:gamma-glutamylputrescine oxidase
MIDNFETWYEATALRSEPQVPLAQNISVDVCVVGAGLAGLTTALELSRRGLKVVVLEKFLIGSGASGRNGGFVSSGFALGMDEVAKHVGLQAAQALYDLSRRGTDYVRREVSPANKMGEGWIVASRYNDGGGLKAHGTDMQNNYDEAVQYLAPAETRAKLNTPRYFDSLHFANAFHIHPLRYCLELAVKARAAGAVIYENSSVVVCEKIRMVKCVPNMWCIACLQQDGKFIGRQAAPFCLLQLILLLLNHWCRPQSTHLLPFPTRVALVIITD